MIVKFGEEVSQEYGQHKVPSNAKIGKLKIVWSRDLPAAPSSVTVIKDSANRYFLSFVVEIQPEIWPQTDNSVGIDLGIKTFAALSDGTKIDAPKPLKKQIKKYRQLSKSFLVWLKTGNCPELYQIWVGDNSELSYTDWVVFNERCFYEPDLVSETF